MRSEAQRMAYFDASPDILCLFRLTADDRLVYEDVNRATERAFKVVRAEVLGRSPAEVVDAETAASLERQVRECIRSGATLRYEVSRNIGGSQLAGGRAAGADRAAGRGGPHRAALRHRRSPSSAVPRRRSGRRRRWRRSASSPAGWHMTSTTC